MNEEKFEQLKKMYPDEESIQDIAKFEKDLKGSKLLLNLLQHDGFKGIVHNYEEEMARINKELQSSPALFETEPGRFKGLLLHARKQWIKDFLRIFGIAKTEYEYTTSKINSLLTPEE